MGVVTGQRLPLDSRGIGLSHVFRDRSGPRRGYGQVAAEFCRRGRFHADFSALNYISVPIDAIAVWILFLRGNIARRQKVFLARVLIILCRIGGSRETRLVAGGRDTVIPSCSSRGYWLMLTASVGTTSPVAIFYAGGVRRNAGRAPYPQARAEVLGRQHQ